MLSSVDNQEKVVTFSLQDQKFSTLEDITSLAGKYFNFVTGGRLFVKDIEGSQVRSDKFEGGTKPQIRFSSQNGVVLPKDYSSFVQLSSFYQFELVLNSLKDLTGIDPDTFLRNRGKFKVMYEPDILIESESDSLQATLKLNAAFVPGQKQFVLYRRSNLERVPLAANLQVIAHEFGHALFEYTFFENKYDNCELSETSPNRYFKGRMGTEYAIIGFNEGFADLISWGLTGSTDIIQASIDIPEKAMERDFARTNFDFTSLAYRGSSLCSGDYYCIGTLFAKAVREAAVQSGKKVTDKKARFLTIKDAVTSIAKIQTKLRSYDPSIFPPPSEEVQNCLSTRSSSLTYDGKVAGAFLSAFVEGIPKNDRPYYCASFDKYFGQLGFPAAARGACL